MMDGHKQNTPTYGGNKDPLTIPLASPSAQAHSNNERDMKQSKADAIKKLDRSFYLHMFIPLYGFCILVAVLKSSYDKF